MQASNLKVIGTTSKDIDEDELLISPDSKLGIDSLDAVEIVAMVEKKYDVKIRDVNLARDVLKTVNTLADFIFQESEKNIEKN